MPDEIVIRPDQRLTRHFRLSELLASDTAERDPALLAAQMSPPPRAVFRLAYLAQHTLQPVRDGLGWSVSISSGYRSEQLNAHIRGSSTSQHCVGEAADCKVGAGFLSASETEVARRAIREDFEAALGAPMGRGVNRHFYLFAFCVLHRLDLDIDQVIHEYGTPGRPAWVHLASSPGLGAKRGAPRITVVGAHTGREYVDVTPEEALRLGV